MSVAGTQPSVAWKDGGLEAFAAKLVCPSRRLVEELRKGRGVRIGEASVVSRRVHVIDPREPARVRISVKADAGQVFYHRRRRDEVIHLDVFHERGIVDHQRVARAIMRSLEEFAYGAAGLDDPYGFSPGSVLRLAHHVDVQTARGGGRITGSLAFGLKESLRRAHENHVHVAAGFPDAAAPLVFCIVQAVEAEVLNQSLEIRKVEKLSHDAGGRSSPVDLSPYASYSDSYLQERHGQGESGFSETTYQQMQLDTALNLAEDFGDLEELREVLNAFASKSPSHEVMAKLIERHGSLEDVRRKLEQRGLIEKDNYRFRLTAEGLALRDYLQKYDREVAVQLRKITRRIPLPAKPYGKASFARRKPASKGMRVMSRSRRLGDGVWVGDLAVPETTIAALKRCYFERARHFRLARCDFHVYEQRKSPPVNVCLLLDASASMAGRRIKAAKHLAEHLLLTTGGKVAVMAFQERDVTVYVPFTKNYARAQAGLRRIVAGGLTPLAHGLDEVICFLAKSKVKNPLALLITDGIPTIPKWSANPLQDALDAAKKVQESGVLFGCIGLQPNRKYLEELVRLARGTLYVVDELDKEMLVSVVHEGKEAYKN